jgi:hypothetical protein
MHTSNPPKKNRFFGRVFERLFASFESGVNESGELIKDGVGQNSGFVADRGDLVLKGIDESVTWAIKGVGETGEMVIDQTTGTVGYVKNGVYYVRGKAVKGSVTMTKGVLSVGDKVVGTIRNGVYHVGDKAMEGAVTVRNGVYFVGGKAIKGSVFARDSVVSVGEKAVGTLINATKFIADSKYRKTVGRPWLKGVVNENQKIISYQMRKNKDSMDVVYRYSFGKALEPGELEEAKKQMTDMVKLVPAFAIFMLPGGMALLPLLGKILPWEVLPDIKPPREDQENAKLSQAVEGAE